MIGPGGFTDPAALEGADAVLVTREHHSDHVEPGRLRAALDAARHPATRVEGRGGQRLRAVDADQASAVHDGLLDDAGLGVVGGLLGERGPGTPTPSSRLAPGDSVEL